MMKWIYSSFYPLLLLLTGCMVESVPPMNFYTLNYPVGDDKKTAYQACPHGDKVLKISPINALSPYNSQAIVYTETPNDLNSYVYSQWSDAPVRLLEKLFQQSIQSQRRFKAVVTDSSVSKADYLLESNLLNFNQVIKGPADSHVVVTIQFVLLDARQRKIIATTMLTETSVVRQNNAQGAVNAFNRASQKLAEQLSIWLIKNLQLSC